MRVFVPTTFIYIFAAFLLTRHQRVQPYTLVSSKIMQKCREDDVRDLGQTAAAVQCTIYSTLALLCCKRALGSKRDTYIFTSGVPVCSSSPYGNA